MKIRITQSALKDALSKVQGIVERRNTLPILSYVLMKAEGTTVEFLATDLEVSLKGVCTADVIEPGTVTILAKKAFEIVAALTTEEVEIYSGEGNWVHVISGKASFRLVGLPKDDFPELPRHRQEGGAQISRAELAEMVRRTEFAISHDHTRYALNGVLLETTTKEGGEGAQCCRMISTDGHRLAMIERDCLRGNDEERNVIIPRKAVTELRRVFDDKESPELRLDLRENHVFFIGEKTVLAARLIEGQFPDYQQVIPKESKRRAMIRVGDFHGLLKRVAILTADRTSPVRFAFSKGQLTVSTNNPDAGEASETMPIEYTGDAVELGFNAKYIQDILDTVVQERIVFGMNEALSPGLITPEGDDRYKYVVMPMRL